MTLQGPGTSDRVFPLPLYPTRLYNFLGRIRRPQELKANDLMHAAAAATGLREWGSEPFQEALQVYCRALNLNRHMHFAGRLFVRRALQKSLEDRLRIQQAVIAEPAILSRPIARPIVIPGSPRSGTTFLHRLMALDPLLRTTRSWEVHHPTPPPQPRRCGDDPRIGVTEKQYRMVFKVSPLLEHAHPMEARLPEECWHLLDRTFIRPWPALYHDVPLYREWLSSRTGADLAEAYAYHKKQLQILQWRFLQPRWLMKSPIHGLMLRAFHATYPDARYIFCHRDPMEIVPSLCSLAAARKQAFFHRIDLFALGKDVLEFAAEGIDAAMKARAHIPSERCLDLSYRNLIRDPIASVRGVYRWLDLELTDEVRTRMERFLVEQRLGKHLGHSYSAAEYGLAPRAINDALEGYRIRYRVFL
jgi:hypothetical protein